MNWLAFLILFLTTPDGRYAAPWSTLYRDGMVAQFSYDHARPVVPTRQGRR